MSRIVIANSLDNNGLLAMEAGLSWSKKLNKEPFILHGDKLADYETLDNVFAHLNLEVHQHYVKSILAANNQALGRQLEKLNAKDANIKFESRSGNPSDVLLAEVEASDVDLLVLGHNSSKGFVELFLGGVTESILHKSKKSILVVKNDQTVSPKKS